MEIFVDHFPLTDIDAQWHTAYSQNNQIEIKKERKKKENEIQKQKMKQKNSFLANIGKQFVSLLHLH